MSLELFFLVVDRQFALSICLLVSIHQSVMKTGNLDAAVVIAIVNG